MILVPRGKLYEKSLSGPFYNLSTNLLYRVHFIWSFVFEMGLL